MQKVVTIRASHSDLQDALKDFTDNGWKVISVTKGSEWGRIGFSYNWTIILEKDEIGTSDNKKIEEIKKESSSASYGKTIALALGLIIPLVVIVVCLFTCAR